MELLRWLLRTNDYLAWSHCWPRELVAWGRTADLVLAVAYLTIPMAIVMQAVGLSRRRHPLLWLFVASMASCGLLYLMHFAEYWWPAYHLDAVLKLWTAGISLVTAVLIWPYVRAMLRRHEELEQHAGELEAELQERREAQAAADLRVRETERAIRVLLNQQSHRSRNVLTKASETIEQWLVSRE